MGYPHNVATMNVTILSASMFINNGTIQGALLPIAYSDRIAGETLHIAERRDTLCHVIDTCSGFP